MIKHTKLAKEDSVEDDSRPSKIWERYLPKRPCLIPRRYIVALLLGLGLLIVHWMRTNVFSAIFNLLTVHTYSTVLYPKERDWSVSELHFMSLSFTVSFAFAQIPGAILVLKFPASRVLAISIAFASTLHLLAPLALNHSVVLLVVLNVLQGFAEGPVYLAFYSLLARWAPENERCTMFGLAYSGMFFGTELGNIIGFKLAETINEEASFYISAVLGLLCSILYVNYLYESPTEDPFISDRELANIDEELNRELKTPLELKEVPLKSMFSSASVWALAITILCQVFIDTASEYSPMVIMFNGLMETNVFLNAIPGLIFCAIIPVSGGIADFIINKGWLPRLWCRRCFLSGGLLVYACLNTVLFFMDASYVVFIMLHIATAVSGFSVMAVGVNFLDVCPRNVAILIAILTTVTTLLKCAIPFSILFVISLNRKSSWKVFIYISTGISIFAAAIFGLFSSSERETWDKCNSQNTRSNPRNDSDCYPRNDMEEDSAIVPDDATSL